jgi:hypothetical protein
MELAELHMTFEAMPYNPWGEGRQGVVSRIVREIAKFETLFTDYERACDPICADVMSCERCRKRLELVSARLADPRAIVWEVWRVTPDPDIVGIAYLTDVIPGGDAKAHYVFWDRDLIGKTQLLERMIQWCFTEHPNWIPLRRITVEAPTFGFAFIRHAVRKLGFGGEFKYKLPGRKVTIIPVEGIKKSAIRWNGNDVDLVQLGRLNG